MHGTTLVANALIERRGAKLGLITTEGFRDILEMGTEQRYDIYDLFLQYPEPLVPRRRRLEASSAWIATATRWCRSTSTRCTPPRASSRRTGWRRSPSASCTPTAIPSMNARRARRSARSFPEIAVSLSSDVVAELWEYQRLVTTCANAFVQPLMNGYVRKLERELWQRGFAARST